MTRRDLLRLGVASTLGGWLYGCGRCDAGFPPNMTMPIFYGYKDYVFSPPLTNASLTKKATGVISNPPVPMARVFYPSIAGTPAGAPILTNCEPFPLVLFVHGDCPTNSGDPLYHYVQWYYFAGELARAGYVVAISAWPGPDGMVATGDANGDTLNLQGLHNYMRNNWEYRDTLMPSPNTAVIGHSYGGTIAAELTTQIPNKAYVSLSADFGGIAKGPQPVLAALRGPSLFMWNDSPQEVVGRDTVYDPTLALAGQIWSIVGTPKHGVLFAGGYHGDYMMSGTSGQNCLQGTCNLVRPLSVDITTTFLTKYLPPGGLTGIAGLVPDSLIVRPQDFPPPPNHGFYAGGMLSGLASSKQTSSKPDRAKQPCFEQVFWQTSSSQGVPNSTYLIPS